MRDLVIFINGILTRPGNAFAWTDEAVRWLNRQDLAHVAADRFEYFCPPLTRRLFLARDAQNLARAIAEYTAGAPDCRLHLVGHSNGCELIARAVQLTGTRFATLHLISGAVERDFTKNGLGERLQRGQIGAVYCYCSRGDAVLKYFARGSQLITGGLLGYGDLGYRGPAGVGSPAFNPVETHWETSFGHSDWFSAQNFDQTMQRVLRNITR